jgi:hypothetical protein
VMKTLREFSPYFGFAGLLALQTSCGDSSGPGNSAASIEAVSSTTIAAAPGAQVTEIPSVILRDANGNPKAGVAVTFTVTSGGGTVTGNHPTSDANGVATVGSWTLGPNEGPNTLVAQAGNLSVTFTASGADPCVALQNHSIGSTTNGQLSAADCRFDDGSIVDFYQVNVATAGTYVFSQTSTAFDSFLLLFLPTGAIAGVNDDLGTPECLTATRPPECQNSQLKILLPAGSFIVGSNSFDSNQTGAYTLTSASAPAHITNCETAFVLRGISSPQSLEASDCTINGILGDQYILYLRPSQAVTISMSSAQFDSYLEIHLPNSTTILASNDDIDGTTKDARLNFTPQQEAFYVVAARTTTAGAAGAYTLGVQ